MLDHYLDVNPWLDLMPYEEVATMYTPRPWLPPDPNWNVHEGLRPWQVGTCQLDYNLEPINSRCVGTGEIVGSLPGFGDGELQRPLWQCDYHRAAHPDA